jgi:hypothetical protein
MARSGETRRNPRLFNPFLLCLEGEVDHLREFLHGICCLLLWVLEIAENRYTMCLAQGEAEVEEAALIRGPSIHFWRSL